MDNLTLFKIKISKNSFGSPKSLSGNYFRFIVKNFRKNLNHILFTLKIHLLNEKIQ